MYATELKMITRTFVLFIYLHSCYYIYLLGQVTVYPQGIQTMFEFNFQLMRRVEKINGSNYYARSVVTLVTSKKCAQRRSHLLK